jgi:3-phenylpropionate/cinnamic acid dioxygenase small subunit
MPHDVVTSTTQDLAVGPDLQWKVEQFLYREARLLDERCYEDWLTLLASDLVYTMPLRIDRLQRDGARYKAPSEEIMIFDDDLESLKVRVKRLRTGICWADDPPARARHAINNVQIAAGEVAGEIKVVSSFMVYVSRMAEGAILFSGVRHDVLRIDGSGGMQVSRRRILGDQSVMFSNNLTMFF